MAAKMETQYVGIGSMVLVALVMAGVGIRLLTVEWAVNLDHVYLCRTSLQQMATVEPDLEDTSVETGIRDHVVVCLGFVDDRKDAS